MVSAPRNLDLFSGQEGSRESSWTGEIHMTDYEVQEGDWQHHMG